MYDDKDDAIRQVRSIMWTEGYQLIASVHHSRVIAGYHAEFVERNWFIRLLAKFTSVEPYRIIDVADYVDAPPWIDPTRKMIICSPEQYRAIMQLTPSFLKK